MDAEIASDALQSLDYAIAEALRNGASSDDISRVMSKASKKFQQRSNRSKKEPESSGLSSSGYRFALLVFAFTIAVTNILTSSTFTSSITMFPLDEKGFDAPNSEPFETVQRSTSQLVKDNEEEQVQSTPIKHKPKSNHQFDDQEEAMVTRTNKKSRTRMILDYEKRHLDFQMDLLGVKKDELMYPCPLDAFFHEGCEERGGGLVCIYPNAILKRIDEDSLEEEFTSFERLTDTRFFPKLYYADERCRTVLQENVRPAGEDENMFCSNYTVYEDFYKSAFKIFNKKNIIPVDLNTCCNTIVNHDHIRIIDFGKYEFDETPEKVRETNNLMLETILVDVKKTIKKHTNRCLRRQWDNDRKKEREKRKKKEQEVENAGKNMERR